MPADSVVRGTQNWTISITNTSGGNVSVQKLEAWWWNYSKLEKILLREKIIWGSIEGVYSPLTTTFIDTAPTDLIVYPGTSNLQLAFLDDYFSIYFIKVYLSNGCYVQYWQ